jgi:hypothetical protein
MQVSGKNWDLYLGDSIDIVSQLPKDSIHYSIFSPPFASLYTYSASERDMGNSKTGDEFIEHFRFLVKELFRVLGNGRLVSFHCMNLPSSLSKDGYIGIKDFRGELIKLFQEEGFIYHSEVVIWKCPVVAMTRTHALGLLHNQMVKDSAMSRQGIPDYLVTMRKPGKNENPVSGGFQYYIGSDSPELKHSDKKANELIKQELGYEINWTNNQEKDSVAIWQKYASPIWMDINPSDTLQYQSAKDNDDEKHICLARGSLILTKKGYKEIQDISLGDLVLTHKGRWMPVIGKKCTGVNPVIQVKAQGVANLVVTPNHKLWTRNVGKFDASQQRSKAKQVLPDWVRSDETKGSYVNLKNTPVDISKKSNYSYQEWKIIGRWLADGHLHKERDSLHISCGKHKLESTLLMLGQYAGSQQDHGSCVQIRINDKNGNLRDLISRCGYGAENKEVPPDIFDLSGDYAKALLDGYLSGDGHYLAERKKWTCSSVSRKLLLGLALLVQKAYGTVASVYAGKPPRQTKIQNRIVNCKQDWIMCFNESEDFSAFILPDGAWKKVRSTDSVGETETWSIEVEEDASYTAEGCIVKNCPLQLEVIERALQLWTNKDEFVLDPFNGIGSTGYVCQRTGRKYIGVELKQSYFDCAVTNLKNAEKKFKGKSMFDLLANN